MRFDVAVLGAGPVGLACALASSRRRKTALLARRAAPSNAGIEAVPRALLALLVELGVTPEEIGVTCVRARRFLAWESAEPVEMPSPESAHVDRMKLERALWKRVREDRALSVLVSARHAPAWRGGAWRSDGLSAPRLIDATGRRAVSAERRVRPRAPWVATTWSFPLAQGVAPELCIAALPSGYTYRLASTETITLGVVRPARARNLEGEARAMRRAGAGWMLDGLRLASAREGVARVASAQLALGEGLTRACVRVGDAALARDALSSQGLATGLSEALYVGVRGGAGEDAAVFEERQADQRRAHLDALARSIASCAFHDEPAWRAYARWVSSCQRAVVPPSTIISAPVTNFDSSLAR